MPPSGSFQPFTHYDGQQKTTMKSSMAPTLTARDMKTNLPSPDPFFSTPRSNTNASAVLRQVMPTLRTAQTLVSKSPRAGVGRRGQCTHPTVNRIFGDSTCNMCGKVPDLGFLYQCQQNTHDTSPLPDLYSTPVVPDESDYFDAKARLGEHLRMSRQVVNGIRRADYDVDQVETLIKQKELVVQVLLEKQSAGNDNSPSTPSHHLSRQSMIASVDVQASPPVSSAGTPANAPYASQLSTPTRQAGIQGKRSQVKCNYQVCQRCRPYFSDRMWNSFESTLQQPPLTEDDIKDLRILNANVALRLGLRGGPMPPPRHPSIDITTRESPDTDDNISVDWTATDLRESESNSNRLDSSDLYPCPGPLRCLLWSRYFGCAYDAPGFDDGRRAENHGFFARLTPKNSLSHLGHFATTPGDSASTASTISLPTPNTSPLTPYGATEDIFIESFKTEVSIARKARSVCREP